MQIIKIYTHTELKSAIKVMLEVGTLKGDSEVGVGRSLYNLNFVLSINVLYLTAARFGTVPCCMAVTSARYLSRIAASASRVMDSREPGVSSLLRSAWI